MKQAPTEVSTKDTGRVRMGAGARLPAQTSVKSSDSGKITMRAGARFPAVRA